MDLYHGDCLEIMPTIPDNSIDMILCDLPYGTTACKWDVVIPFDKLWLEYNRVIKKGGCIALFGSEPFSSYLRMSNIKNYKYDWIWEKSRPSGHLNAKKMPLKNIENICIFYKEQCLFNPQFSKGNPNNVRDGSIRESKATNNIYGEFKNSIQKRTDQKYPKQSLFFKQQDPKKIIHLTQKPVKLFTFLIFLYKSLLV